jgi:hypothetical protein
MQASHLRLEQRRKDQCHVSRAQLELVSVSQPWPNIIYLFETVLGVFSRGFCRQLPGTAPAAYLAPPPPVSAGSSTVTDQSTLLDSITR